MAHERAARQPERGPGRDPPATAPADPVVEALPSLRAEPGLPPGDGDLARRRAALQRLPSAALRQQVVRSLARHSGNAAAQRLLAPDRTRQPAPGVIARQPAGGGGTPQLDAAWEQHAPTLLPADPAAEPSLAADQAAANAVRQDGGSPPAPAGADIAGDATAATAADPSAAAAQAEGASAAVQAEPAPAATGRPPAGLLSRVGNALSGLLSWAAGAIFRPLRALGTAGLNTLRNLGSRLRDAIRQSNLTARDLFLPQGAAMRIATNLRRRLFADAAAEERRLQAQAAAAGQPRQAGGREPSTLERADAIIRQVEGAGEQVMDANREIIEGAVLGDFKENPTIWNTIGQIAIGFVPYAGQVADIRDAIAAIIQIKKTGGKDPWAWFNLVLVAVGFIPGIGDAIKAIGRGAKGLIRRLAGGLLRHGGALFRGAVRLGKALLRGAARYGRRLWNGIRRLGSRLGRGLANLGRRIAGGVRRLLAGGRRLLSRLGSRIRGAVSSAIARARGLIGRARGFFSRVFSRIASRARQVFDGAKRLLARGLTAIKGAVERGRAIVQGISRRLGDAITRARNFLRQTAQDLVRRGRELLNRARQRIGAFVDRVIQRVRTTVSNAWDRARAFLLNGWRGVRDAIVNFVKTRLIPLKDRILNFFRERWERLKDKLRGKSTPSKADLARAADAPDRGGLTKAGRALQKHGGRPGSAFPPARGNPDAINQEARRIVDEIVNNPASTTTRRHHARFGEVIEVRAPDGRGIRYDADGNFIGFLEP